jgi:hypothetical protein
MTRKSSARRCENRPDQAPYGHNPYAALQDAFNDGDSARSYPYHDHTVVTAALNASDKGEIQRPRTTKIKDGNETQAKRHLKKGKKEAAKPKETDVPV